MTRHRVKFSEVIAYIEANLDGDINVEKLCRLTGFSKYHFHRQCSAYFGLSVMSLVRLLRLKRAAYQLAYRGEVRVLDIALDNGYDSHEAFSRAFKKVFGQSPAEFSHSPDWTPWHSQYEPIIELRKKIVNATTSFDVQVVDFPETMIAVMAHKDAPNLLGATIRKFIHWRKENRLPPSKSRTFNLIYDDPNATAPEDFRFDVCCAVKDKVEEVHGIVNKKIPAGRCAVVRHVGSDDSIGVAINYLYANWLPESNYEIRDFPIFLERVSFFPEVPENEMITDIYLPIS